MTKFMQKSFSVGVGNQAYRDAWDRIFGKKPVQPAEEERKALEEKYDRLRKEADAAWERGNKSMSDALHQEAGEIAKQLGTNWEQCDVCVVYFEARDLAQHRKEAHDL